MITKKLIKNLTAPRDYVDEYIESLKLSNSNLKVIDVGGGINSWCKHTSHVVDIFVDPGSKEEFEKKCNSMIGCTSNLQKLNFKFNKYFPLSFVIA